MQKGMCGQNFWCLSTAGSGVDGVDVSGEIHKKHGKDMQQHGLNQ